MKKCSKCHSSKPIDEYRKDKHGRDGIRANCKGCDREYRHDNYLQKKRLNNTSQQSQNARAILPIINPCISCNSNNNLTNNNRCKKCNDNLERENRRLIRDNKRNINNNLNNINNNKFILTNNSINN